MNRTNMARGMGRTFIQAGRGQSLVEFALILPVAVLIIAGIFDLGRAFFASITITNAAREGARYGTLHPDDFTGMVGAAVTEAQNSNIFINSTNVTIICPIDIDRCSPTLPITVTVNYNYDDMIFSFFFPGGIQMERQEIMIVP